MVSRRAIGRRQAERHRRLSTRRTRHAGPPTIESDLPSTLYFDMAYVFVGFCLVYAGADRLIFGL